MIAASKVDPLPQSPREAHVLVAVAVFGTITPVQTVALVVTAVVVAVAGVALRWCCRRESRRRARLDVFSRSLHEELAETGYRALLFSPVVLCVIVIVLLREGGPVLPGLVVGGIAGLTAALGLPQRLINLVRPGYVAKMDPAMRRLHQEVTRRRSPTFVIAVVSPLIFAAALGYGRFGDGGAHDPQQLQAIGFMLGMVQAGMLAWGVQYVQVLRSLQRDADRRGRLGVS